MAVLEGISGIQLGDSQGGKIALDINRRILRILQNGRLSFLTATMPNMANVNAGTIWFDVPNTIKSIEYNAVNETNQVAGAYTGYFNIPQSGKIAVNIDIRRVAGYEVEQFDLARLQNHEGILGAIASSMATAIEHQLNGEFLSYLNTFIKANPTRTTELKSLPLESWAEVIDCRKEMNIMKQRLNKFSKIYSNTKMGVPDSEFITLCSPEVQTNLENAFWGEMGSLSMFLGKEEYHKFGKIIVNIDGMLQNAIPAGTSLSWDKDIDTLDLAAVMIHTEAVAMPIVFRGIQHMLNPLNGNFRWLTKYEYGLGMVRPDLIWGFTCAKNASTPMTETPIVKDKKGFKVKQGFVMSEDEINEYAGKGL